MTRLDLETMRRVSEVLRAAGYLTASDYVYTWSSMPSPLRDDMYPGQEPFAHAGEADDTVASSSGPIGRIPLGRNQPELAELAERLDRADTVFGDLAGRIGKIEHAFVQNVVDGQHFKLLNERIDKVAEIIGERISGLVDQVAALKQTEEQALARAVSLRSLHQRIDKLEKPWEHEPGFPTGGADTAEAAAADAVLPVPQRGDRVRLEGARSIGGFSIDDGWYTVTGGTEECFQVAAYKEPDEPDSARRLAYVPNHSSGLKEVRHAGH